MVFEVFRRRQKTMMVILAVFAMFAFVFAGVLDRFTGQMQPGYETRVIATAWGKNITGREVYQLQHDRAVLNQFVARAMVASGQPRPNFPFADQSEAGVLQGLVLREKARQMGMSITDQDVNNFIGDLTQKKLSRNQFYNILNGSGSGDDAGPLGVSESDLFRIIGEDLLIRQVVEILTPPVVKDSPLAIWEELEPSLTNVQLEVVKLPVQDFAEKVEEPKEEQLKEVYEKYKAVPGNLETGVPGLLEPHKVNIEYVVASIANFEGQVTVTEEEAKKYYEENKEEFRLNKADLTAPSLPGLDDFRSTIPPLPPVESPSAKDAKAKEEPKQKAEPKEPAAKDSAEPKTEKPAETKPAEEKPAAEAPAKQEEAPAPKAEEKSPEPAKEAEPTTEPKKDGAFLPGVEPLLRTTLFASTYLLQDAAEQEVKKEVESKDAVQEKAKEPAEAPKEAKPAESREAEKPAEKAEPKKTEADAKPAEKPEPKAEAKAESKPAEEKPAEKDAQANPKAEDKGEEGKAKATDEEKPEYEPYEEVREQIIKKLRTQKAKELAKQTLGKIHDGTMEVYKNAYIVARSRYRQTATRTADGQVDMSGFTPPSRPDLERAAKRLGLEYGVTGLVSYEEAGLASGLRGATNLVDGDASAASTFREVVFSQGEFRGRIFEDESGEKLYLTWKIEDRPERQPTFEEAKEKVVQIWKLEQAKPLAEAKAKEFAEKVKEAEGDMAKVFKDSPYTFVTTGLFPRRQSFQANPFFGSQMQIPTTIPEVPNAGTEFLDKVFELKVGDVAALPDESGQNYYVVKVKDKTQPNFDRFTQQYNLEMTLLRNPAFITQSQQLQIRYFRQRQATVNEVMREANFSMAAPEPTDPAAPPVEEPTT